MKKIALFIIMLSLSFFVSAQKDTTLVAAFNVMLDGQEQGPYSLHQIEKMIQGGQVTRNTMVLQQGMATWSEAEQIPEINEIFKMMPGGQAPSSDTIKVSMGSKVKVKNSYYYWKRTKIHGTIGATLISATLLGVIAWAVGEKTEESNIVGYGLGALFAIGTVEFILALSYKSKAKKLDQAERAVTLTPAKSGVGIAINF